MVSLNWREGRGNWGRGGGVMRAQACGKILNEAHLETVPGEDGREEVGVTGESQNGY